MHQELAAEQQKFELLDNRLSDIEKSKLYALNQDQVMLDAIEKALLYALYGMGTIKDGDEKVHEVNWAYAIGFNLSSTDEQVGKELRIRTNALSMLADAFKQIKKFNERKVTMEVQQNPAL